jgi:hypothetical protein
MGKLPKHMQQAVAISKEKPSLRMNSSFGKNLSANEMVLSLLEGLLKSLRGNSYNLEQGIEISFYPFANDILRVLNESGKFFTFG